MVTFCQTQSCVGTYQYIGLSRRFKCSVQSSYDSKRLREEVYNLLLLLYMYHTHSNIHSINIHPHPFLSFADLIEKLSMCCRFFFCFFSVILKLCLAQDWNSIQPEQSTSPILVQQEDLNQPGTTIAGGGFQVDNSQPRLPTFFDDNPSVNNNAADTTGFRSLLMSNDPLIVHDGNAVAFALNSPQTFNLGDHQEQIGATDFSSTTASAAHGSEAGPVLDSSDPAQLDQAVQRDPQPDLALIGDDSPVPSLPFLDILNNVMQGNPSPNDPERSIEPIHNPEERLTNPEKPHCEDGKFPFCCNKGYPDGYTMKNVPLAQRVHKRRLCNRCMCNFLVDCLLHFLKISCESNWQRKREEKKLGEGSSFTKNLILQGEKNGKAAIGGKTYSAAYVNLLKR